MGFGNKSIVKQKDVFSTIKALLVVTGVQCKSNEEAEERLSELESLCLTAGIKTVAKKFIHIRSINPATFIGKGQTIELAEICEEECANLIVFNEAISPRVQRNLEEITSVCIVDRQEIILQIFANRAVSREARLQVELAQLQYSLPRLTRKWADLSQQRGGVKGSKGSGEKQLELDRRTAQNRISRLKKDISEIDCQRMVKRRNRTVSDIPNIAIVGYTNSGKSTFINRISDAGVLAEDKLFATLDTTTRRVTLPQCNKVLFTDTVGFVSDLPHELVDSFRSTLEEVVFSDLLIIVLDASRKDFISCWNTTMSVLEEIGASEIPYLILMNKMDIVESLPEDQKQDALFCIRSFESGHKNFMEISVLKDNLSEIMTKIESVLKEIGKIK